MRIIKIIGIFLLLLGGVQSFSQDVRVTARLDTGVILIGDHVGLKLRFEGPSGSHVIWPSFNDTILGNIIVIGRSKVDSSFSKDRKSLSLTQELNLTCFDSGFYTIPQIPFRYRIFPDTAVKTAATGLSMLMVHTLKVDTTSIIKPIKGPLQVPLTFLEILPYLLIALAVIIFVLALVWYIRKRKKNEPLIHIRPKVKLHPHEKALQELEKLRIRKLWQQGNIKEYHSELTDILRTYIEDGFGIPAMECTTHEIIFRLAQSNGFSKAVIEKVEQILQTADMVKFAKAVPSPQENENVLSTGIEFVNQTIRTVVDQAQAGSTNQIEPKPQV
ncbi:MAG: hypothetical protein NTU51_05630 [Bacteroidetes bacterium]|nr:hypothetical protein [Bacteroidota bacterium]